MARRKSFVVAAEELGLTQPAVSRSVRELETILGHDLIDRSTRGAELTRQGETFLRAAETGLAQLALATDSVVAEAGAGEAIRIGALPNVCSQFLPQLVMDFKAHSPEVVIHIIPGTNAALLSALRRGETDFVIGRLSSSEDMKGLAFEALFDEPLIFVVRADHPLANGRHSLQAAMSYPFLLPPEGTIIRQEANRYLASQSVSQIPDVIETTSSDFQRAYLRISDAVAIVPSGVLQGDVDQGALCKLSIGDGELSGPVGLTVNPELPQGHAATRLLSLIRAMP